MRTREVYAKIKKESELPVGMYFFYCMVNGTIYPYQYSLWFHEKQQIISIKCLIVEKKAVSSVSLMMDLN